MNPTPIVSIICPTYNQETYIAQTIESFLLQKTSFPFEIIIHDDASTDNTPVIVRDFERRYPNLFSNVYQTENQFSKSISSISRTVFPLAKGKYIALCEGDDYWIDPLKLQKQVDFLESNLDYSICFHNVNATYDDKEFVLLGNDLNGDSFTIEDLSKGNFISTLSVVFRNFIKEEGLPKWFEQVEIGDYPLHLINACKGKIKFLPDVMAVYRIHNQGMFGGKSYKYQCNKLINLLHLLSRAFSDMAEIKNNLDYQCSYYYSELAELLLAEGDKRSYVSNMRLAFNTSETFLENWLDAKEGTINKIKFSKDYLLGKSLLRPARAIRKALHINKRR